MFERMIGMQASMKQEELLAWASGERWAVEAEQGRQGRTTRDRWWVREAIAGVLLAMATRIAPSISTGTVTAAQ
jgi:hypothetical protein